MYLSKANCKHVNILDRTLTVKTAQNELVYGPWSNERLSAFQFEGDNYIISVQLIKLL